METLKLILIAYGHHIAPLLLVAFLGLLSLLDTIPGRILLVVVGVAFVLTMWLGITFSIQAH